MRGRIPDHDSSSGLLAKLWALGLCVALAVGLQVQTVHADIFGPAVSYGSTLEIVASNSEQTITVPARVDGAAIHWIDAIGPSGRGGTGELGMGGANGLGGGGAMYCRSWGPFLISAGDHIKVRKPLGNSELSAYVKDRNDNIVLECAPGKNGTTGVGNFGHGGALTDPHTCDVCQPGNDGGDGDHGAGTGAGGDGSLYGPGTQAGAVLEGGSGYVGSGGGAIGGPGATNGLNGAANENAFGRGGKGPDGVEGCVASTNGSVAPPDALADSGAGGCAGFDDNDPDFIPANHFASPGSRGARISFWALMLGPWAGGGGGGGHGACTNGIAIGGRGGFPGGGGGNACVTGGLGEDGHDAEIVFGYEPTPLDGTKLALFVNPSVTSWTVPTDFGSPFSFKCIGGTANGAAIANNPPGGTAGGDYNRTDSANAPTGISPGDILSLKIGNYGEEALAFVMKGPETILACDYGRKGTANVGGLPGTAGVGLTDHRLGGAGGSAAGAGASKAGGPGGGSAAPGLAGKTGGATGNSTASAGAGAVAGGANGAASSGATPGAGGVGPHGDAGGTARNDAVTISGRGNAGSAGGGAKTAVEVGGFAGFGIVSGMDLATLGLTTIGLSAGGGGGPGINNSDTSKAGLGGECGGGPGANGTNSQTSVASTAMRGAKTCMWVTYTPIDGGGGGDDPATSGGSSVGLMRRAEIIDIKDLPPIAFAAANDNRFAMNGTAQ